MRGLFLSFLTLFMIAMPAVAGDHLKLNPHLDYSSDSEDGPLITGDAMDAGFTPGKPAYVLMYGEACYNSKRQARRTVELYEKYKGRVQFVIIDLDQRLTAPQEELRKKYYTGYIPSRGCAEFRRSGALQFFRRGGCGDGFANNR